MTAAVTRSWERSEASFESHGIRCAAWLYRPHDAERPGPAVLMGHGWAGIRRLALARFAERFADSGLTVLVFDYRGWGDSNGEPRLLVSPRRQLADWRAALTYLRGVDGVDHARIALWGTSYAGGHVVRIAASDDSVAAVVSQAGHMDPLGGLRSFSPTEMLPLLRTGARDLIGGWLGRPPTMITAVGPPGSGAAQTSEDAAEAVAQMAPEDGSWPNEFLGRSLFAASVYRPLTSARRVRCPVLFCVGEQDTLCPPAIGLKAARRAPFGESRRYPHGHYGFYYGEGFEAAVADQTAFLTRHLMPV